MKRGSLEISVQAIVIIVLAMTLLGLGLGFVRGQFKSITETSTTVQEQVRQQILDDLRVGNRKLSFPTDRFTLTSSERKDIAIGIKNTRDEPLRFVIEIQERGETGAFEKVDLPVGNEGSFFFDDTSQELPVNEARVFGILHEAKTQKGTYLYKIVIKVLDDADAETGDEYDSKSFFVTVV